MEVIWLKMEIIWLKMEIIWLKMEILWLEMEIKDKNGAKVEKNELNHSKQLPNRVRRAHSIA